MFGFRITFISLICVVGIYGCSEVEFSSSPSDLCEDIDNNTADGACEVTPDGGEKFTRILRAGKVDVLFVIDNSGSMFTQQQQMAARFPNFLNSISFLDFRLAVVTTDTKDTDGRLIEFPNGQLFVDNETPNLQREFQQTIQREETRTCNPAQANNSCPSGDERGIYAAIRAIQRGEGGFFRKDAHLAIIILSDEDERSFGGTKKAFPLESGKDFPEDLISAARVGLGSSKTMSVHAVVIRPGNYGNLIDDSELEGNTRQNIVAHDQACLVQQNSEGAGIEGFVGYQYAKLARPDLFAPELMGSILEIGVLGSICAADYGEQLGDIGDKIGQNVNKIPLMCRTDDYSVEISPDLKINFEYSQDDNNNLIPSPPIPAGYEVKVEWTCP